LALSSTRFPWRGHRNPLAGKRLVHGKKRGGTLEGEDDLVRKGASILSECSEKKRELDLDGGGWWPRGEAWKRREGEYSSQISYRPKG